MNTQPSRSSGGLTLGQKIKANLSNIITIICTICMAGAAVASAIFAYQLSELSKIEWLAKRPNITLLGGTNILGDLGYFGAGFINGTNNAATEVKTYVAAFSCDKEKNRSDFPSEYLHEKFFSNYADIKTQKLPNIISGGTGAASEFIYFDQSQIEAVKSDLKDIYFVAKVTFKDSFGDEHQVRYCGKMSKLTDIGLKVSATPDNCESFNCTDKGCDDKLVKSLQAEACAPFVPPTNVNDLLHSKKPKKNHG